MVHLHIPGAGVAYCGVAVRAGSRNETDDILGLAHFVEHTLFKGTTSRYAWHIINRMEAVGGELNAYTTKEETVVYTAAPSGNLARAAELVSDIIFNSIFPYEELEKEREVVADEIDSYLDTPSEAIFDDFEDMMFAGSRLGHNILGTRECLDTFHTDLCRGFMSQWYTTQNMVVFYAGNMSATRAFAVFDRAFRIQRDRAVERRDEIVPAHVPVDIVKHISSHQCHTVMGARIGGMGSADRYATALLTNILGGPGMNSLLNVALRERRGLVYSVEASTAVFSDCGALAIYYGCDPEDDARCRRLVKRTIESVADDYLTPSRLARSKKQYLGQLVVASENIESRILNIAHSTLFKGRAATAAETIEGINSVTLDDIRTRAAALLPLSSISLCPE